MRAEAFLAAGILLLGLAPGGIAGEHAPAMAAGGQTRFQVLVPSLMDRTAPGMGGGPRELQRPVAIAACRNGAFTGKAVAVSDTPMLGLKAAIADLKADGGAVIPAASVSVFYGVWRDCKSRSRGAFFDGLAEAPPAEVPVRSAGAEAAAIQEVWLKVRVPADAAPGLYKGSLSVSATGVAAVQVPVEVKVIGWKLPDPRDYATHVGLIQSPESVAMYYEVPLWSEEHWKRMEKSFRLMGEVGSKVAYLYLLARTNLGNEQSMVRWIRQPDGTFRHDFTVLDRYLDLQLKHLRPDVVCLYAWEKYVSDGVRHMPKPGGGFEYVERDKRKSLGFQVTGLDPATGKTEPMTGPRLVEREASLAFWKPVTDAVKERLEKRGLLKAAMIGITPDLHGSKEGYQASADFFNTLLPGVPWMNNSHPGDTYGKVGDVPIRYWTQVYLPLFPPPPPWDEKRKCGWQREFKCDIFPRPGGPAIANPLKPWSPLGVPRVIAEGALLANKSGIGRTGVDFWEVYAKQFRSASEASKKISPHMRTMSINGRFPESTWDQLDMNTATEDLFAPGPDGAIPTARFEMLREGVQECEARIFIEKALCDPARRARLGADFAKRCQELLDERARRIRSACEPGEKSDAGWTRYAGAGSAGQAEALFSAAADVAARLDMQ